MKPLVIFGSGELGLLAHAYFKHEAGREVVGFTVDAAYLSHAPAGPLPQVAFETLEARFPPSTHELFVALGYTALNGARAAKCAEARRRGYSLASHVSPAARTWPDLVAGDNVLVMEGALIQPFVRLGRGVVVWAGAMISHHVQVEDDCFIAAGVTLCGGVQVGRGCFVGAGAIVREGVTLAPRTLVGAGALILASTEEGHSYVVEGTRRSGIPSERMAGLL